MNYLKIRTSLLFVLLIIFVQAKQDSLNYQIDLSKAKENTFVVKLNYKSNHTGVEDFMISKWTPGYYQILDFDKNISNIKCNNSKNEAKDITKFTDNTWRIATKKGEELTITYEVNAKTNFIAKPYIDNEFAFVRSTGVFIFPASDLQVSSKVKFINNPWKNITTSLKKINNSYNAVNIDDLLDSPILIGNLNILDSFQVKGKNHYFSGRQLDDFDTKDFIISVKKIVETATDIMQDIPYDDYSFISIGKGNGGIEQTNSTALTFNGELYNTPQGKQKLLNFITHEYFHHFNVKRIRPVELGPFNYSGINRTNSLWVSEGLNVYYEGIIMNRAGLKSREQMLNEWTGMINRFESNEGKNFQTLAESSAHTWEDGPFGIKGKTISFYEKGPLVGMLLDLTIRHNTQNKKSLDDVMRKLYYTYYKGENRGFTENEVKKACEEFAKQDLSEIFSYIYTLEPINYNKYFEFAGLKVNSTTKNGKTVYEISALAKTNSLQKEINKDLFR